MIQSLQWNKKWMAALAMGTLMITSSMAQATIMTRDYLKIQDSRGQTAIISAYKTGPLNPVLIDKGLAPRGSAALTPSGALAATGIKYVIHAASGAMSQGGVNETPTLEGVKLSIINAIRIATAEKIKRIAIPLIGGGIFLDTLGVSKEQLAYTIIDTARTQKSPVEIIFVAYSDDETAVMNNAYARAENPDKFALKIWNYLRQLFAGTTDFFNRSQVSQGSITDFNAHGAEAIVNAANMELMFGGGLSGIIGKATQDREHIDETGALLIKSFYGSQGKK